MDKKESVEDLKTLRNYTLGVVGFATAISAVLIQILHFKAEPTIACTVAFACGMLIIVYLIGKSEGRNRVMLEQHIKESQATVERMSCWFDNIDKTLLEIQRSNLRIELGNEIKRRPENHDTILRMAERYFLPVEQGGLGGDWVMTDLFMKWVEAEKVGLPKSLASVGEK